MFEYAQSAYFVIFSWTFTWYSTISVKFRELCRPRYNWPYAANTQLVCTSWPTSWFDWSGRSWWTRPIWAGEFHQSWSLIRLQAPNPLIDNALMYIAGWAVRKVMPTLACTLSRETLVTETLPSQYASSCHLLRLKQNGGLIVPSVPCILIIRTTEQQIRCLSSVDCIEPAMTSVRVPTNVLAELGSNCFVYKEKHALETQVGIDNHNLSIVRTLKVFYNVRQHHLVKLHNARCKGKNICHTMTKTIMFKGQWHGNLLPSMRWYPVFRLYVVFLL